MSIALALAAGLVASIILICMVSIAIDVSEILKLLKEKEQS